VDAADFASLSDEDIITLVENACHSGGRLNLGIPFSPETVKLFLGMFRCQKCGACCTGAELGGRSGVVLEPSEVDSLAENLGIPRSRFKQDYTSVKGGRRILKYPCPFYASESRACRIYAARPQVCRNFPLHAPLTASDGTYLLVVPSICPEGKRVAVELLKMRRDVEKSLAGLGPAAREKIQEAGTLLWDSSKRGQAQSGWFKPEA
jgi:Fe-S-cluster containining protein